MPYQRRQGYDYFQLVETLRLLKLYHEIGIYTDVVRTTESIIEEHWYEYAELGLEHVAPIFYEEAYYYNYQAEKWINAVEIEDKDSLSDYPNRLLHFSSPEMQEYYRLCRLYEYREGLCPERNHFSRLVKADADRRFRFVSNAGIGLEESPPEVIVELCPEDYFHPFELVDTIHDTLNYYKAHLNDLRLEMLKKPPVFLPALPAPKIGGDECGESKDL